MLGMRKIAKVLAQIICYMHNFLQISSFNDGIMTHLKGEVIEKKNLKITLGLIKLKFTHIIVNQKFTKAKGT